MNEWKRPPAVKLIYKDIGGAVKDNVSEKAADRIAPKTQRVKSMRSADHYRSFFFHTVSHAAVRMDSQQSAAQRPDRSSNTALWETRVDGGVFTFPNWSK